MDDDADDPVDFQWNISSRHFLHKLIKNAPREFGIGIIYKFAGCIRASIKYEYLFYGI